MKQLLYKKRVYTCYTYPDCYSNKRSEVENDLRTLVFVSVFHVQHEPETTDTDLC